MTGGRCFGVVAWLLLAMRVDADPLALTEEERAWIAAHPVVRMAVDANWKPVEYLENGQHLGLSSEYVAAIERKTGLRFERVPNTGWGAVTEELEQGEVDVLPAALKAFTSPQVEQYIRFTSSYYVGTTFVITGSQSISIYDLNRLNGKVVALKGGGAYQARIHALYPYVQILPTRSTEEALLAVVEGRADAALDGSQAVQPFLRRKYRGVLHVSGVIGSLPMELAMGVRRDLPVLYSILDKSLASLTAGETDAMIERWREETDYGAPTFSVLVQYYGPQLALAVAGLLLISGFALHARRERQRAVKSEKEKTMFLAVMSHEIRSPMNAILASMELLQRSDLPQEPRRLINLAASGAENLLRLLDDVLDISKLEAGRLELDIGPVDIMELVHTVADLVSFQAREKGIELRVEEREPIARRVMVDRLRVGQILHNLLSNAVKFTLKGSVTISVGYEGSMQPGSKGWLHLRVIDTGVGMDAEVRKRLFEPYAQASAATARKFGGTGLGLPICRELVELMQGRMEVESEPGEGTTIAVHVPCKLHATAVSGRREITPAVMERDVRLSGISDVITVLLVEDTPANQVVMQAQLDALGCRSTLAPDGAAALQCLEQGRFDVVLMDCDLPDISGYEVTRRWRVSEAQRNLAPTPIIAISASTDTGHTASCFEAGMDGVLKKPIKLAKLQDALQLWCEAALDSAQEDAVGVMDHDAMAKTLVADFDALKASWQAGDLSLATHYAHRLVGASEVLGAMELAASAGKLEALFKQSADQVPAFDAGRLEQLHARLREWATGCS